MKRNVLKILIVIVAVIAIAITCFNIFGRKLELKLNWSLNVPIFEKIIYAESTEPSFNGDGFSYTILKTAKIEK